MSSRLVRDRPHEWISASRRGSLICGPAISCGPSAVAVTPADAHWVYANGWPGLRNPVFMFLKNRLSWASVSWIGAGFPRYRQATPLRASTASVNGVFFLTGCSSAVVLPLCT
jgi:hypothetical protein